MKRRPVRLKSWDKNHTVIPPRFIPKVEILTHTPI